MPGSSAVMVQVGKHGFVHLFFAPILLPTVPIELEWQHLKKDELCGQIFDDELDLAYAVIDGVKARGEKGNYSTQRIKFDSNRSG
jgi:putative transposase